MDQKSMYLLLLLSGVGVMFVNVLVSDVVRVMVVVFVKVLFCSVLRVVVVFVNVLVYGGDGGVF